MGDAGRLVHQARNGCSRPSLQAHLETKHRDVKIMAALFISTQIIKEETIYDDNVDDKLLRQIIYDSQEQHILPVLGSGLYDSIKAEITAGSVSSDNQTLLNTWIKPALKYWVLAEGTDVLMYRYANKSVLKQQGDKTFTPDVEEVKRLISKWEDKAEWHTNRVRLFLVENSSTYPLYLNPGTGADVIHPARTVFQSGMFLQGRRGGKAPDMKKGMYYDSDRDHYAKEC